MLAALEKHGELMMNACEMNCEYINVHTEYREQISSEKLIVTSN